MLEAIGAVLVGIAITILVVLNWLSRSPLWGQYLRRAGLAEAVAAGIVTLLASGVGLYEFGSGGGESEAFDGPFLAAVATAFALMWWWFRSSAGGRVEP